MTPQQQPNPFSALLEAVLDEAFTAARRHADDHGEDDAHLAELDDPALDRIEKLAAFDPAGVGNSPHFTTQSVGNSPPVAAPLPYALEPVPVRKVVRPVVGSDGLFEQPDAVGAERERDEAHNRERFANHFHYADPYAGNARTFDDKGDYNCGRCNMAQVTRCLLVDLKMIDRDAGSCADWENESAGDAEMPLHLKSAKESGYGIAQNGKGFGCHRCPYASNAHAPDSQGRGLYCGKGDFRVFGNACCALNGAPVVPIDDRGAPESKDKPASYALEPVPRRKKRRPGVTLNLKHATFDVPALNIPAPEVKVDVHVPEQKPAEVHVDVHVPEQKPADVKVDIHVPEQKAPPPPVVNVKVEPPPPRRRYVERDADGLIVEVREE